VAYLEAFVVQYAFTPRGRCSDMDVGGSSTFVVKHEDSRIIVRRAQKYGLPAEAKLIVTTQRCFRVG
jgi:hypothetical protein